MEKYYCVNCDDEREAKIECVQEQMTHKGIAFTYPRYNLICLTCGKEIYDYDLERKNSLLRADAYRKAAGLLTSEEIKAIRLKYHCSQNEFSKILNLGDKAIAKYESGSIQDSQIDSYIALMKDSKNFYSQKMKSLSVKPLTFEMIQMDLKLYLIDLSLTEMNKTKTESSPCCFKGKRINNLLQIA